MCTAFCASVSPSFVITGRSLDYDQPTDYAAAQFGSGQLFQSVLNNGVSWVAKYGIYTIDSVQTEYNVPFEGMNAAGLSISGNLANAQYPTNAFPTTVSSDDMVNYVLSQAGSLSEAKTLMTNVNIVSPWLYHYILFDRDGGSLVVEFVNGRASLYSDMSQVLTNNPDLHYQLENQNNYANLRDWSPEAILPDQGDQFHGQGMLGLPGDWMSSSRYTRVSNILRYCLDHVDPTNPADQLAFAKRAIGSASLIKGIDVGSSDSGLPIYTQIQIVKDLLNSVVYTREYAAADWSATTVQWA